MKFLFIYEDNETLFEVESDSLFNSIMKLKRYEGKFINMNNNIIYDINRWRIKSSISISDESNINIQEKINI